MILDDDTTPGMPAEDDDVAEVKPAAAKDDSESDE